eukprot:COSAG02_NODE_25149_length_667_cov_1.440141_1_plen_144_part_00
MALLRHYGAADDVKKEASQCNPGLLTFRYCNCIYHDYLCLTAVKNYVKHRAIRLCCRGVRYRGEAPVPHLVDGCSCDYHKLFMNEPTDSASVSVAAEASFSFSQSASPSSTSAGGPSSSRAFPVSHNHQRQHEQGSEIPGRRS